MTILRCLFVYVCVREKVKETDKFRAILPPF